MVDVSFITINYNSSGHTIDLIKSILEQTKDVSYEIIVVDNSSEPGDINFLLSQIKRYSQVKLVRNRINSGFSSGNMLGVNYASGKYLFFINNDCKLLNNTAKILYDFHELNKNAALSTAKVIDVYGSYRESYGQFPSLANRLLGGRLQSRLSKNKFPSNKEPLEQSAKVEVVTGACMFFRAISFNEVGGFDTCLFLYCEEEDICRRIIKSGQDVYIVLEAMVFHEGGGSSSNNFELKKEYFISYNHLLNKHLNIFSRVIVKLILFVRLLSKSLKSAESFEILVLFLCGFPKSKSLRYKQKIK